MTIFKINLTTDEMFPGMINRVFCAESEQGFPLIVSISSPLAQIKRPHPFSISVQMCVREMMPHEEGQRSVSVPGLRVMWNLLGLHLYQTMRYLLLSGHWSIPNTRLLTRT